MRGLYWGASSESYIWSCKRWEGQCYSLLLTNKTFSLHQLILFSFERIKKSNLTLKVLFTKQKHSLYFSTFSILNETHHFIKSWNSMFQYSSQFFYNEISISKISHTNISNKRKPNVIFHKWLRWIPWLKLRKINSRNEGITFNAILNLGNVDGITPWRI